MKRGYTLDLYRRRADLLREVVPDIELGSDWIVGFSGETDEDFAGSERFLEEQGFLVNYVFKYDPRPSTKADERLEDDVPEAVKKERNQRLLRRGADTAGALPGLPGPRGPRVRRVPVRAGRSTVLGRTMHGMPVSFEGGEDSRSNVPVEIDESTAYGMAGRRVITPIRPAEIGADAASSGAPGCSSTEADRASGADDPVDQAGIAVQEHLAVYGDEIGRVLQLLVDPGRLVQGAPEELAQRGVVELSRAPLSEISRITPSTSLAWAPSTSPA